MTKERLYLFDTTLRDGAQTSGVDFTVDDKLQVAGMLDRLGVDYVEGGYPGANPTDSAFFEKKRTEHATFTAFGMTKRAGVSLSNDPGLKTLLDASADAICFVAKTWDYHVRVALQTTEAENLEGIRQSVTAAREKLEGMIASKRNLEVQIENLDARMKTIQAAQTATSVQLDDSQLARAKKLIGDLNKQLDVAQKMLDADGKFTGLIPVDTTPAVPEDLSNQIDEYFGRGSKPAASADQPAAQKTVAEKTVAERGSL